MRILCAQAEALCRAVAPDVASGPLYVVLRTDLPPQYRNGDDFDGCTLRHLDLVLQPELKRLGRWRGRGPAMLLDPNSIAAGEVRRPTMSRRRAFPTSTFGVVLHELAHIIDIGPDDPNPPGEMIAAGRSLLTTEVSETDLPSNGPNAPIPWRWHEWRFIRTAMHLAHRAIKHGYALSPTDVFDASDYRLSSTRKYLAALDDEPERMGGSGLVSINKSTPPTAFAELWEADLQAWVSSLTNTEESIKALARCGRRILIPQHEGEFMLSELLTELEVRRKDREAGFVTVARKLTAGEKVAAVTVERLLADTGKTPGELAEAVELFRRRFEWHGQRQRGTALEKERAGVQDRIVAEDRKLELAEKAHEEASGPLYGRLHEIREAVNQADDARRQLIHTCPDAKLKAELAEVEGRLLRLRNEATSLRGRSELVKQADSDVETADRLTVGLVPGDSTSHIDRLREQAARKREAGERALAELASVQKQIAVLEREETAMYERMAKP